MTPDNKLDEMAEKLAEGVYAGYSDSYNNQIYWQGKIHHALTTTYNQAIEDAANLVNTQQPTTSTSNPEMYLAPNTWNAPSLSQQCYANAIRQLKKETK